jgi:hypothetical protein
VEMKTSRLPLLTMCLISVVAPMLEVQLHIAVTGRRRLMVLTNLQLNAIFALSKMLLLAAHC